MANFGEVAFTLQHIEKAEEAEKILQEQGEKPIQCQVDNQGARLI
jgi:hypothetical protein